MSNIEDTKPIDVLAARVWSGTHYHYPHIEAMTAELTRLRTALAASQKTVRVLGEECKYSRGVLAEVKKQRDYEAANKLVAGGTVTGMMESLCSLLVRSREATNADPDARRAVEGA